MPTENILIRNKKASFEYSFIETYVAGIQLAGTEIKSIRANKASINDAYCAFINGELFVKGMHIAEYEFASHYNHMAKRERKLLLNKSELFKLAQQLKDKSLTIIPVKLFLNEKGFAKLEIALAKGKKTFDKRDDIKKRDLERETGRRFK